MRAILIIIGLFSVLAEQSIPNIYYINGLLLLAYLFLSFWQDNFISFDKVWVVSFIYIIIFEGIFHYEELFPLGKYANNASDYLLTTNWVVLFFYGIKSWKTSEVKQKKDKKQPSSRTLALLMLYVILYLAVNYSIAIDLYNLGRIGSNYKQIGGGEQIINAASLIIPAFIVFYFKNQKDTKWLLWSTLASMPILLVLVIKGSRFPLLFSFCGFILVAFYGKKLELKKISLIGGGFLLLLVITNFMGSFRGYGFRAYVAESNFKQSKFKLGSYEAVVLSTAKMFEMFDYKEYMLGKSSSFLLYAWIPRTVWPDKPKMLGYWLIRERGEAGFASNHSASFGYAGDAYADFGFLGGVFFSILIGLLLRYFNEKVKIIFYHQKEAPIIVLASISYSYVFFFVRSPLTATISFAGIILSYYIVLLTFKDTKVA